MTDDAIGWDHSAAAWIADMEDGGDHGRRWVLDKPMLERVAACNPQKALDVGCGEGRFCRMLSERGIDVTGIDPTEALLAEARRRDPRGTYLSGQAEALGFEDGRFDLVVAYLTLIDIEGVGAAIPEMARVLRPGGALLIANLNGFATAGAPDFWITDAEGKRRYTMDNYLTERANHETWRGISIINYHRPLETYMTLLLGAGLRLTHFAEPLPHGGDPARIERYRRVPHFLVMEWVKPEA